MNEFEAAAAKTKDIIDPERVPFFDFLENGGLVMPTETVTFYLNRDAAHKIKKLQEQYADGMDRAVAIARNQYIAAKAEWTQTGETSIASPPEPQESDYRPDLEPYAAIQTQIDELQETLRASALVLHLTGVRPDKQDEIRQAAGQHADEIIEALGKDNIGDSEVVAQFLAETASKYETEHLLAEVIREAVSPGGTLTNLTPPEAARLANLLPESDLEALFKVIRVINTATALVDPLVDAGFRSEPADAS